jgi:hypothetical protein
MKTCPFGAEGFRRPVSKTQKGNASFFVAETQAMCQPTHCVVHGTVVAQEYLRTNYHETRFWTETIKH